MKSQGVHLPNHDDDCGVDQYNYCEVNFFYLFGLNQYYDMYGIINCDTNETILSVADTTTIERVISKLLHKDETNPEEVNVDKIIDNSKIEALFDHTENLGQIFINTGHLGRNRKLSHVPTFEWFSRFNVDRETLLPVLVNQRSVKSEQEIENMRRVCKVGSEGHVFAMKKTKPGMQEFQIEALFNWYCSWNGCTAIPYTAICGSGKNSATLHYGTNNKELKDGDLILNDMGCRANMYCSDITNTYPINGKFSQKQKEIYNIVLEVKDIMFDTLKPGVVYQDVNKPGLLCMVRGLDKLGFFNLPQEEKDYPEGDMEKSLLRLSRAFCPHAWGHFIGLYTHDVGHFKYDEE